MKCPYRKIVYHHQADECGDGEPVYDEESFAECYGRECPLCTYYELNDTIECERAEKEKR